MSVSAEVAFAQLGIMQCDEAAFVIVKFLATPEDEAEYIEVALRSWLTGSINEQMECGLYWPPRDAMSQVKNEMPHKTTWQIFKVQVLKFYDTFLRARAAVPKFCADSHYETESEVQTGKGCRMKFRSRKNAISSSSDEEVPRVSKQRVPSPPMVKLSTEYDATTASSSASQGADKPKRRRLVDKDQQRKEKTAEIKQKVQQARAIANARMLVAKSPKIGLPSKNIVVSQNISPIKSKSPVKRHEVGMTSPWKVQNLPDTPSPFKLPSPPKKPSESRKRVTKTLFHDDDLYEEDSPDCLDLASEVCQPKTSSSLGSQGNHDKPNAEVEGSKITYKTSRGSESALMEKLEAIERVVRRNETAIKEVSKKSDLLIMNVTKVLKSIVPGEKRVSLPEDMPKLPLEGKKELNVFEKFLKSSKTNEVSIMDHLSNYVVRNAVDAENKSVRNILSNLMVNSLAELYNLDGKGVEGKESFRALKLYEIVQAVLVSAFEDISLPVLDSTIGAWLTNAKWRDGGSKNHLRKKNNTAGAA